MFTITDAIQRAAAGLGILQTELQEFCDNVAKQFPDAAERLQKIQEFLAEKAGPIRAAELPNLIKGFAADIEAGILKIDPGAWSATG